MTDPNPADRIAKMNEQLRATQAKATKDAVVDRRKRAEDEKGVNDNRGAVTRLTAALMKAAQQYRTIALNPQPHEILGDNPGGIQFIIPNQNGPGYIEVSLTAKPASVRCSITVEKGAFAGKSFARKSTEFKNPVDEQAVVAWVDSNLPDAFEAFID